MLQKPMNVNMNGVAIAGDLRVGPAPLPPQSSTSFLDQSSLYCEQSDEGTQGRKPVDMARLDKRRLAEGGYPRGRSRRICRKTLQSSRKSSRWNGLRIVQCILPIPTSVSSGRISKSGVGLGGCICPESHSTASACPTIHRLHQISSSVLKRSVIRFPHRGFVLIGSLKSG